MPKELLGKIKSVQMKLDDFIKGMTTAKEKLTNFFKRDRNNQTDIRLSAEGIIKLDTERCPNCGSRELSWNGTNPKTLENGVKVQRQRYICRCCGEDLTTPLEGYTKHNHYRDKTKEDTGRIRAEDTSLRKIKDLLELLKNIAPSPETIRQWINKKGKKYKQDREISEGSGIYGYDEQYIKIDGERFYRLAIKDVDTRETVNEKIVDENTGDNIQDFLLESLKGKKLSALITDGDPQYDDIIKDIAKDFEIDKIIHQLCVFHALKNLSKATRKARKSTENRDLGYPTDHSNLKNTIKLVFSLDNEKKKKEYLKRLPEKHQEKYLDIIGDKRKTLKEKAREIFDLQSLTRSTYHPKVVKKIEWIDEHWDDLTHFYENEDIPKTNNAVEQHFSSRHPNLVKSEFKDKESLENHLFAVASFKNENLSSTT